MYTHLKLQSTDILPIIKLTNLGRINVICGKNNSGKTTLLNAINDEKNVSFGKEVDENTLQSLIDDWIEESNNKQYTTGAMNFNNQRITYKFGDTLKPLSIERIFQNLIKSRKIFFSDEIATIKKRFWELLSREVSELKVPSPAYESRQTKQANILKNHFENESVNKVLTNFNNEIFDSLLSKDFFPSKTDSAIILSPKRVISLNNNLESVTQVEETGRNIVNKLHSLKNTRTGSASYAFYSKLLTAFVKVSGGYKFDIELQESRTLNLIFSTGKDEEWVEAERCGLGLRDLLVILYFALESEHSIILIEEPENHIHPEMQRKLLRFLSEETEKQFFITTHSNVFVNSTYVDKVFFTKFEDGKVTVSDETKQAEMLHDLGYSVTDNLVSDLIILVEGPSDTPVIEEFLSKFNLDAKYNIKTWALGGDIMDQHNLSVFLERYKVVALVDSDPGSKSVRNRFVAKCEALDIPVTRLERYSIENYFTIEALKKVFKGLFPDEVTTIKPKEKLFKQINIDVKSNNRKIAKEMSVEDIENTDFHAFFEKIEAKLQE